MGGEERSAGTPVAWGLHREVVLLLGWSRAILLQFAHPLVARGVADHSSFRGSPLGRWRRLGRTVEAMLALTFGPEEAASQAARRINAIHDRVHGELAAPTGVFAGGTRYSAHDPALLRWVHATLTDSLLRAHDLYVGGLTAVERDRYCQEVAGIEPRLAIPAGFLPRSVGELDAYLVRMLGSGEIVVTDTARALASELLSPPLPRVAQPLVRLGRLPAIGLLPPAIRAAYGFAWTPGQERALRRSAALVRTLLPLAPPRLRYWRAARAATSRGPAAAS